MVDGIRNHFPRKYRSKGMTLNCPSCTNNSQTETKHSSDVDSKSPRDDNTHIMTECEVYEEMRANKDILASDTDLVSFFREVLQFREENNET